MVGDALEFRGGFRRGGSLVACAIAFLLLASSGSASWEKGNKALAAGDPEKARKVKEFQNETDRRFAFGGGRVVAKEERLEAGFSEQELEELDEILADGPSRETLVRAAEICRDRHQARQRGETVPPLEAAAD